MDSSEDTQLPVPDDLVVAAVAAGCTVVLALVLRFVLGESPSYLVRLAPLWFYFVYLFVGKNAESGPLAAVRTWVLLVVATTLGVLGYVAL